MKLQGSQGEGWRSAACTFPLPMWPGLTVRGRRHMWVECVVGSLPYCSEGFSSRLTYSFPLSSKINTPKFQRRQGGRVAQCCKPKYGLGSHCRVDGICGLSLLLVLSLIVPTGFSPG